jgi:hypothetical protein
MRTAEQIKLDIDKLVGAEVFDKVKLKTAQDALAYLETSPNSKYLYSQLEKKKIRLLVLNNKESLTQLELTEKASCLHYIRSINYILG